MNDWEEDEGRTYCKRERESARVRMCDGWSFNMSEKDISKYSKLKYLTEKGTYEIPVSVARARGWEQKTKQDELKLYIPGKVFVFKEH